jgi:hypothetical protein
MSDAAGQLANGVHFQLSARDLRPLTPGNLPASTDCLQPTAFISTPILVSNGIVELRQTPLGFL